MQLNTAHLYLQLSLLLHLYSFFLYQVGKSKGIINLPLPLPTWSFLSVPILPSCSDQNPLSQVLCKDLKRVSPQSIKLTGVD